MLGRCAVWPEPLATWREEGRVLLYNVRAHAGREEKGEKPCPLESGRARPHSEKIGLGAEARGVVVRMRGSEAKEA